MNTQNKIVLLSILLFYLSIFTLWLSSNEIVNGQKIKPKEIRIDEWQKEVEVSHATEVWISVLEWCESKGRGVKAINPKDLDGTPSYYHFQFKPNTIRYYAVKYKWLPDNLEKVDYLNWGSDYDFMRNLVRRMTKDEDINWNNEFPVCVDKYGYPPNY